MNHTAIALSATLALSLSFNAVAADVAVPAPPAIDAKSYILIDHDSGRILAERNPDERMEPASIVKLMTAYAVFDALRAGKLTLAEKVTVSENAWRSGGAGTDGSTSFLEIHSQVPVEDLIQGMIVQSGNDATIALAERVGGTEATFALLMNNYARKLGMKNSNFENSTGLPTPNTYMSARDIATLDRAIIHEFPHYYRWYSQKEFTWNKHRQQNRNGLLTRDPTVDGIKTGHTNSAGYCLTTSAKRDTMRLVAAVLGTTSFKAREDANLALLNYGFAFYETRALYSANKPLGYSKIWKAQSPRTPIGVRETTYITIPRGQFAALKPEFTVQSNLMAPISASTKVGDLKVTLDGKPIAILPLYPLHDEPEGSLWTRAADSVRLWFN